MRLDTTVPYEEVIGVLGVKWAQEGRYFSPSGLAVSITEREGEDPLIEVLADDDEPETTEAGEQPLEALHWRALKAMVESYGFEWSNKEQALKDLRSRD